MPTYIHVCECVSYSLLLNICGSHFGCPDNGGVCLDGDNGSDQYVGGTELCAETGLPVLYCVQLKQQCGVNYHTHSGNSKLRANDRG